MRCVECGELTVANVGTAESPLCPACYARMSKESGFVGAPDSVSELPERSVPPSGSDPLATSFYVMGALEIIGGFILAISFESYIGAPFGALAAIGFIIGGIVFGLGFIAVGRIINLLKIISEKR